ncbi:MAG: ammonia-forming cytochrome c nitrite reductase subunit c552 [Verrucomicrobia bacterium]|nr:MAG: ammonia-forming cytochrome c nitrite reductase subunit c552 [Verrucomicrobiota bacterium]
MSGKRLHKSGNKGPRILVLGLAFVVVAVVAVLLWQSRSLAPHSPRSTLDAPLSSPLASRPSPLSEYAGSQSCQPCHAEAYKLWEHSNHALAERFPNPETDRKAFANARTPKQTSVKAEGTNYLLTCPGLSSSNETHLIVRVIGNDPLRQFLVSFPGGRFQTFEASYDPHADEWFDVFGDENRQPGEWGHWTGRGMNWNSMCAACHNTGLRKNYEEATDTYHTTMAEMSVGCEACHGPLKEHVEQENKVRNPKSEIRNPKFEARRPQDTDHVATNYELRTTDYGPRTTNLAFTRDQVLDTCASCHARRTELTGNFQPGDSFYDHYSLTTVDESDRFYPDGQVRDEDYELSAFLGSRMHASGVRCLDCHEPHSMKPRLPGNWLCMRCHNGSFTNAPLIDPVAHSHHRVFGYSPDGKLTNTDLTTYEERGTRGEGRGTAGTDALTLSRSHAPPALSGGDCVNCHMPQTAYMQRHWRHDHGFTVPDPLMTKQFGIPNACTRCHSDKSADWALESVTKWYGDKMDRPSRARTQWIARARNGEEAAREPLLKMLEAETNAYWRAVAVGLLAQWVGETNVQSGLLKALGDVHPLVREKAVRSLEPLKSEDNRISTLLRKRVDDSVRNVRLAAAWTLRHTLLAGPELEAFLDFNSDQPTGQMQEGALEMERGDFQQAVAHYQKAVLWDSNSAPIRHDLAVALDMAGRANEAIPHLEAACRLQPKEAEYEFKLALAWNEVGAPEKTITLLEKAVALDPRHARAWYNLGLARNARGQSQEALDALVRAESISSGDPQIPYARATILLALRRIQEAETAARRALELDPGYADARALIEKALEMSGVK